MVLVSVVLCRATEELFQILEDNQMTLSTMKASRYVKAFDKEVDKWERTLSHILEVIEMILQVQKQWMYLEVLVVLKNLFCPPHFGGPITFFSFTTSVNHHLPWKYSLSMCNAPDC